MTLDDLKQICKPIEENPLWHLCRSNTENAMSNFWAYLIEYIADKNLSIILGNELATQFNQKIKEIKREKDHMDLQIYFEGESYPRLIIENKFKSLDDEKQINKYYKKIVEDKRYRIENPKPTFVLITPAGTKEFQRNYLQWLSYDDVYKNIKSFFSTGAHHKKNQIIDEYLNLLHSILHLAEEFKANYDLCLLWKPLKKTKKSDFNIFELVSYLTDNKLYAFIAKNLTRRYEQENWREKYTNCSIKETEYGFTNGTPLFSWKWELNSEYLYGIQVQNGQLRYFIEQKDPNKKIVEKIEGKRQYRLKDTNAITQLNEWLKNSESTINIEEFLAIKEGDIIPNINQFSGFFIYKYIEVTNQEDLEKRLQKVLNYIGRESK